MRSHAGTTALASALLLVTAACGSGSSGSVTPSVSTSTAPPAAHKPLDIQLSLSATTVKAGTDIHGTVTLDNTTGRPLKPSCGLVWAVGLTNSQIPFNPAFAAMCRIDQQIKPGLSVYPVTITTTYQGCSQSGQADGGMPGCLPGPMGAGSRFTAAPPLPVGTYETKIVVNGLPSQDVRLPSPIVVTLT